MEGLPPTPTQTTPAPTAPSGGRATPHHRNEHINTVRCATRVVARLGPRSSGARKLPWWGFLGRLRASLATSTPFTPIRPQPYLLKPRQPPIRAPMGQNYQ